MAPSYSAQYDELFTTKAPPPDRRQRFPKPSIEEQSKEPGAQLIPFSASVWAKKKINNWLEREPWSPIDKTVTGVIVAQHLICLAAPFTFTWPAFYWGLALLCTIGCLGIDVSFHRQLTHRSFATPKWLEYTLAFIGTMGGQMDPIEWCRHHRYHHTNTDTAMDPHSSYEGFFWSHCGWLMHNDLLAKRAGDNWIIKDLVEQPFYRFLKHAYPLFDVGQHLILYCLGGWSAVVWTGAMRQVMLWHITWSVNSACHIWGSRPYATGDLSTNCAWLALPTFGEAWHNNHHAFPYSARHGLEAWQVDIAWYVISGLEALGLASDIRVPSEEQKAKMLAGKGKDGDISTDNDDIAGVGAPAGKGKSGKMPPDTRQRCPKPSMEEQSKEPGAQLIPLSQGVWVVKKVNDWVEREPWTFIDRVVTGFIVSLHLICLAAPFTFTWPALWWGCLLFFLIGCLGIDVSFHRQLTHRSFATPKWLEYTLAYLGTLGNQQLRAKRAGDNWIVKDLVEQPFYRFLHWSYPLHSTMQFVLLYWFGGWPALVWGGAVRQVVMWHVTWLVNSACHIWGSRPYATGDLSTNCAWLALPTFGEAWHNNHHAFPYSARHGLEAWQVDIAWVAIRAFEALGLAWDIRLPSEEQKQRMAAGKGKGKGQNADGEKAAATAPGAAAGIDGEEEDEVAPPPAGKAA
ncbi:Palmitoyl-monogalactosyldiacylglycerol delta-7 desaturase, chloroplastic [Micractinium conductrix]|uniref:Palmitoyl-monogalactosyldiacylglycerol delta-7 desaturase, chloroplastic n=1 Tax=Micractinium conductrix TaxID=554055 RepID=A0A2P6VMK8_9CHLO|nr:Palmitoyl-monogalactosyldiacylglycerol delta-7 desaturase, chloroplastic [Micractinium conductrix]|eukprot:PSC75319.1 Palmitoyl-monogalactosyldiacylglycerol delta-7 desaturase, chloroplastic [Micractinium conductrix]